MKEVADNIEKWRRYYANTCPAHQGGYAKKPLVCACETAAQVQTYIECVIPEDYQKYQLDDFTGMKDGKRLVKEKVVQEARQQLVSYCWTGIEEGEDFDMKTWWPRTAMDKRRRSGSSIIIYGNPWASSTATGTVKTFRQPIGRTMLAAIVMREAIRLRALHGHQSDGYAWVSYNRLYDKLMQRAKDVDAFSDELTRYQNVDWLCVDGFEIEKQNEATRAFKAKVLDSFFDERLRMGLPNILVFQDDLSQDQHDLRQEFGISVNSIINSSKTTRVKLLESKEGK